MLLTVQFKAIYNLKILRYVYFIVFALMCQIEEEGYKRMSDKYNIQDLDLLEITLKIL